MVTKWKRKSARCGHRVLPALCLAGALFNSISFAQTNAVKPAADGNRFLFIVETSSTMERRTEATLKIVQDLLASKMSGQIHKGDTLGIWTFNDDLHAGIFPLQQWSPESQKAVTGKSLSFLKQQKNEHSANLEKVLPTLEHVIKSSDALTVVLISAGQAELHGTPFDSRINQSYRLWRDEQQKARMPIVTALRCSAGKVVDYSIAAAPWPLELPAPKPETQFVDLKAKPEPAPQKTNAPAVSQAPAPPKPATTLPPLIISGKKSVPAEPQTEIAPAENPNAIATVKTEAPVAAVVENAKQPLVTPANIQTSTNASLPKSPLPASALSENHANEKTPVIGPALAVRARENADVSQPPAKATLLSADTKPETVPAAIATPTAPSKSKPRPAADPQPPGSQTAVATPSSVFTRLKALFLLFGILAAVGITMVFAVTRQRRAARSASLITRSFDRK